VSHSPLWAKSATLTALTASHTGQFSVCLRASRICPVMLATVGKASK